MTQVFTYLKTVMCAAGKIKKNQPILLENKNQL